MKESEEGIRTNKLVEISYSTVLEIEKKFDITGKKVKNEKWR